MVPGSPSGRNDGPPALNHRTVSWDCESASETAFGAGRESADGQGCGDGFERLLFSVDAPDELDEAADEHEDRGDGVADEDVPAGVAEAFWRMWIAFFSFAWGSRWGLR